VHACRTRRECLDAFGGLDRVRGRVELHLGGEHDVVPDLDRGAVEEDAVKVGVEALAHLDVAAVVAVERRFDVGAFAGLAQELLEQLRSLLQILLHRINYYIKQFIHI
jgi:hypothetical protein